MATTGLDQRLVPYLNDPRDLVFVHLMMGCGAVGLAGIVLFFTGGWIWLLAPLYYAVWGLGFLDRFILMLHCTSHRPLFRSQYAWMKHIIPWAIGPFFGQTPQSYVVHHIGMHHIEDNLDGDLSTTMHYQRDSALAWLRYVGTFLTVGLPLLARYHWRRGSKHMFWRLIVGEAAFWSMVGVLLLVNWRATLVVFIVPVLAVRLLMMAGNWGQHAFIDPADPAENFRSSINCINTRYNRRCFNDGYHIVHHLKPRLHYTEMPGDFDKRREEFGSKDAIVFDGIDFFQVWLYLMLGLKDQLAKRFVHLPGAPQRTHAEVLAMLETRLKPIAA